MKRLFLGSVFFMTLGLLVASGGCGPKGEDPNKMIAAAKALDAQFVEAYNKRDVDGIMATYWNSPELVSYPPDMIETRGWQATKEAVEKSFVGLPPFTLELTEINYKVLGDSVISWGRWRFTVTPPGGTPEIMDGRYTDLKAKRDGKWVFVLDHASAPLPPPPSPPPPSKGP